ncbi:cis-prenyltransferase [Arachnomyces sp. PD_36]|nr:cis-prenyltransferase [Arachnomyces sp. PD_36]
MSSSSSSLHLSQLRKWILTSPPIEWGISQVRELLIGALRQGPVPRHVAFVMDGNRRFARNHRIETVEGHNLGFEALAKILEVCYKSGVRVVTIYAFSIENFKRSKYEVDALMDMAKVKLSQLAQHGDLLDRYGASIRVLGRRELVKRDVLEAVDRAVELTSRNGDAILNICFPYTSRDEITGAIRNTVVDYSTPIEATQLSGQRNPFSESHIAHNIRSRGGGSKSMEQDGVDVDLSIPTIREENVSSPDELEVDINQDGSLSNSSQFSSSTTLHHQSSTAGEDQTDSGAESPAATVSSGRNKPVFRSPESITPKTLTQHMFTADNPPLDLLVRTSGVERLSDFMLWQCHQNTQIVFLETLWPEFDLWTFLPVMWEWQWRARKFGIGKHTEDGLAIEGGEDVDGDAVAEKGRKERGRRSRARESAKTKSM